MSVFAIPLAGNLLTYITLCLGLTAIISGAQYDVCRDDMIMVCGDEVEVKKPRSKSVFVNTVSIM